MDEWAFRQVPEVPTLPTLPRIFRHASMARKEKDYGCQLPFHYDDLSEQSGTITLEQVAELLAHLIAKHLIAQANRARITRHASAARKSQPTQPTNPPTHPS